MATTTAQQRYTEADYTDFPYTGPGTLAGRYLRRFWQPVAFVREVRELLNTEPFVGLAQRPEFTMLGRTYAAGFEAERRYSSTASRNPSWATPPASRSR